MPRLRRRRRSPSSSTRSPARRRRRPRRGGGPAAYIFLILEALADAWVKVGLSRRNAQRLVAQTGRGLGSSAPARHRRAPARRARRDMVTGARRHRHRRLQHLEQGGLRRRSSTRSSPPPRARELGRGALQPAA
ncbi:MAG: hypothetical protein HS111_07450 [Kofleriaceae bacterium]|nr:hypothetical protein [Kofleriaceae bacterium]